MSRKEGAEVPGEAPAQGGGLFSGCKPEGTFGGVTAMGAELRTKLLRGRRRPPPSPSSHPMSGPNSGILVSPKLVILPVGPVMLDLLLCTGPSLPLKFEVMKGFPAPFISPRTTSFDLLPPVDL